MSISFIAFIFSIVFLIASGIMTLKARYKSSLTVKTSKELELLRINLLQDFSVAKKMRTYGAMGHIAEKLVKITGILDKRGIPYPQTQKPVLFLVGDECNDNLYPDKIAAY